MSIELTENAARHVQTMLEKRGHGLGLRLGVRQSGCSGFAYVVDYADKITENDVVFETRSIKVVVDKASLPSLDGTQVDYATNSVLNQGFDFHNPQVQSMCGCGESFSV